jgi:hypothetical protein
LLGISVSGFFHRTVVKPGDLFGLLDGFRRDARLWIWLQIQVSFRNPKDAQIEELLPIPSFLPPYMSIKGLSSFGILGIAIEFGMKRNGVFGSLTLIKILLTKTSLT